MIFYVLLRGEKCGGNVSALILWLSNAHNRSLSEAVEDIILAKREPCTGENWFGIEGVLNNLLHVVVNHHEAVLRSGCENLEKFTALNGWRIILRQKICATRKIGMYQICYCFGFGHSNSPWKLEVSITKFLRTIIKIEKIVHWCKRIIEIND